MDIRELRYFVHVARAGSFSRAASQLNVAQPALSRQLKKLEEELEVQLLVRHGRGVHVTEAGALLLSEAEELIERLARTLELLKGGKQPFVGQVSLGVAPTSGLLIVPEIFKSFKARWPHATLVVREGISSLLEEWLIDRRIDVAILHNPSPLDGIDLTPILHERMVLACAPDHPAAGPRGPEAGPRGPEAGPKGPGAGPKEPGGSQKGIRFRDLATVPLILPSLPHSNRRLLERAAIRHNTRLNLAFEVDSIPLIKAMVKRGFGATIQTFAGVALEVAQGELVAREIEHPPLVSTICIGMPREAQASWLALEVARLVRECVEQLVADKLWAGARPVEGGTRR